MFNKTKDTETTSRKIAPSVISSDVNLLGNIISDGLIDFDGNIHGNIQCHTLVIRPNARIHGEVKADSVQVSGVVKGTIEARTVVLHPGANVEGTIMHEQITVEEGATVDGKLKKKTASPALLEQKPGGKTQTLDSDEEPAKSTPASHIKEEATDGEDDSRIMEHIRLIAANE